MPAEVSDPTSVWNVLGPVLAAGGLAAGWFASGFLRSFRAPEGRTEEKRVVLESADIADMGGLRGVGAKLSEMHPAVLSTSQNVAEALVILRNQETRAAVTQAAQIEARRLREEERREEERREGR